MGGPGSFDVVPYDLELHDGRKFGEAFPELASLKGKQFGDYEWADLQKCHAAITKNAAQLKAEADVAVVLILRLLPGDRGH
jgi:hypothetical protein